MSRLFVLPRQIRLNNGIPAAGALANFYLTGTTTRTDTFTDSGLTTPHANPVVADANGVFPAIYLDPSVTYRVIVTDALGAQLDDVDPLFTPGDADVAITDAGEYFDASDIEGVLQEIGLNYFDRRRDETVNGNTTFAGFVVMNDNELRRALLRDVSYRRDVVNSVSGTATLNLEQANAFTLLLDENTTIAISNPIAAGMTEVIIRIAQASGGGFTVDWPSNVRWPGGLAPTMSSGANAVDQYVLRTYDGGTTYLGNFAQNYQVPV